MTQTGCRVAAQSCQQSHHCMAALGHNYPCLLTLQVAHHCTSGEGYLMEPLVTVARLYCCLLAA